MAFFRLPVQKDLQVLVKLNATCLFFLKQLLIETLDSGFCKKSFPKSLKST